VLYLLGDDVANIPAVVRRYSVENLQYISTIYFSFTENNTDQMGQAVAFSPTGETYFMRDFSGPWHSRLPKIYAGRLSSNLVYFGAYHYTFSLINWSDADVHERVIAYDATTSILSLLYANTIISVNPTVMENLDKGDVTKYGIPKGRSIAGIAYDENGDLHALYQGGIVKLRRYDEPEK
jgi:hypothetical protein